MTDGVGHFKPQGALSQHRGANSLLRWVLLRSRCQFSLLDHQTLHSQPAFTLCSLHAYIPVETTYSQGQLHPCRSGAICSSSHILSIHSHHLRWQSWAPSMLLLGASAAPHAGISLGIVCAIVGFLNAFCA